MYLTSRLSSVQVHYLVMDDGIHSVKCLRTNVPSVRLRSLRCMRFAYQLHVADFVDRLYPLAAMACVNALGRGTFT